MKIAVLLTLTSSSYFTTKWWQAKFKIHSRFKIQEKHCSPQPWTESAYHPRSARAKSWISKGPAMTTFLFKFFHPAITLEILKSVLCMYKLQAWPQEPGESCGYVYFIGSFHHMAEDWGAVQSNHDITIFQKTPLSCLRSGTIFRRAC